MSFLAALRDAWEDGTEVISYYRPLGSILAGALDFAVCIRWPSTD